MSGSANEATPAARRRHAAIALIADAWSAGESRWKSSRHPEDRVTAKGPLIETTASSQSVPSSAMSESA